MLTFHQLEHDPQTFLALTGLTLPEFQHLLPSFARAYALFASADLTLTGRRRYSLPGSGCKAVLSTPEQKLLFILVYLKTYPLQALMGELFGLRQPGVNKWIHRLLPILRDALDELGVLPERDASQFAQSQSTPHSDHRLIIDATERRRQRPKNKEKQALYYSGKKKTHTDKNVVVEEMRSKRIGFLSQTYAGKTHDKKIADSEEIRYPPETVLYKDTGFQGYEPAVKKTCQAKKKATARRADGRGKASEPKAGKHPSRSGA